MTSTELQTIRHALCLTQAQLAESLNKSVGTIARWERKDGKHPIPELAVREINRMLTAQASGTTTITGIVGSWPCGKYRE